MKKAVLMAVASCLLMTSVAFAFETPSTSSEKGSSIEQMAKKKKKKKAPKTA
ncbi:hypothetical protein [Fundidesulfovibrio soli]|uniref:hypothetical protein n=1 Tax=Fundidesulfovibrio soli TaxID=2922716 RepID=UPI001FAFB0A6|nr:hypothetical protein [Fundidesulfovibrio soli]